MTKFAKKTIQLLLAVSFVFTLVFGVSTIANPKTAKAADTAITFSAACLGDASDTTYGTSIRFDTSGLQWETYHNWVDATRGRLLLIILP